MRQVDVSIEIDGKQLLAGRIAGENERTYAFQYDENYLGMQNAAPVSISLPLQEAPFSPERTAAFFNGLLPEGFTRKAVAQWMHEDEADYLSILYCLGRECLGAIQIHSGDEEDKDLQPSYEKLTIDQVKALAREGADYAAELVTKAHLSLTGATGKVGLYYREGEDAWYLPHGTAPSTHIVKQSHVRLKSIVVNEQLSLLTASLMGIDVPESFVVNMGQGRDEDVLLATARYDRYTDKSSDMIDGLIVPYRLHQEDFSQALGIPAKDKYEKEFRGEEGYLPRMFSLLRNVSENPLEDQLKLWDRIVYSFLIGNTDGHLKNYSLLYGKNLHGIRLAPAYDLVSTVVYESSTRDMSFYIGEQLSLDDISRESFQAAAELCGISPVIAMRRFDTLADKFDYCLTDAAGRLSSEGLPGADDICEKVRKCAGCSKL